ncbi:MAG: MBL fold metallo-hydrolase [Nitrospirae bacterium]|nr:MBL fold metallo-hydrolase [Nitrospirota bacterium]
MTDDLNLDISKAIEIAPDIWWIGTLDRGSPFQRHPYVLFNRDEAVLFEPGSQEDFHPVCKKLTRLVPLGKIRYIVLSHQDPDLSGSLPEWRKVLKDDVQVVTHSRTAVLLRHYGASFPFYLIDQEDWMLRLSDGRKLSFLFAPWCHCPGTFMTYDETSRSLFSGDIFGAITYHWSLYAQTHYEKAMFSFHEDYMASSAHLRLAMSRLKDLNIDRICPQHGSIIPGNTGFYIDALLHLRCGLDLIAKDSIHDSQSRSDLRSKEQPSITSRPSGNHGAGSGVNVYHEILGMVIEREIGILGKDDILSSVREIKGIDVDDQGKIIGMIEAEGEGILEKLLNRLEKQYGLWAVLNCRLMLNDLFREHKLEIPHFLKRLPYNNPFLSR